MSVRDRISNEKKKERTNIAQRTPKLWQQAKHIALEQIADGAEENLNGDRIRKDTEWAGYTQDRPTTW